MNSWRLVLLRPAFVLALLLSAGVVLGGCGAVVPQTAAGPAVVPPAPTPALSTPSPTATWVSLPTETPIPTATPSPAATKLPVAPVPGALAPDFVVSDPDGNPIQLSAYRGKRVLLNFWATWCPPCRVEMPALQEAYTSYAGDDFVILAINYLESSEDIKAFLQSNGLTFPVGIDSSGEVFRSYRVASIPTSLFLDRNGVVLAVYRGPLTKEAIDQVLARAP